MPSRRYTVMVIPDKGARARSFKLSARRIRFALIAVATLLVAAACEDGPEQVFEPFKGDTTEQNGFNDTTWTQEGSKGFDEEASGDSEGRARFCDEAEA